jgi:L-fucose mutarotase
MLKGIDPRIDADLLRALAAMGHGDLLAVVDANFPADAVAHATVEGRPLAIGADAPGAVRAVLSLMPLDGFVEDFAARMEVVGEPGSVPPVQAEVQAEIDAVEGRRRPMVPVERFAFYDRARGAYAVLRTAERRFYGCFLLRKGVIAPEG